MRRGKFGWGLVHRLHRIERERFVWTHSALFPRRYVEVSRQALVTPLDRRMWRHLLLSVFLLLHGTVEDPQADRAQYYRCRADAYPDYGTGR